MHVNCALNSSAVIPYYIIHCRKICEIQKYTTLSNTIKHPCNALYFSVSRLVWTLFLKQSRYGEIRSVTQMFYRVRQCSISRYFTYRLAVIIVAYGKAKFSKISQCTGSYVSAASNIIITVNEITRHCRHMHGN